MKNKIMFIDVGGDLEALTDVLSMYGGDNLVTEQALRFYVGRAVGYASEKHHSMNIFNRVVENIKQSIKDYYYLDEDTTAIENKIINAWTTLASTIASVMDEHLYVNGVRNKEILALRSIEDQLLGILIFPSDEELEKGDYRH